MTWQDVAALTVCLLALAWLVRRLFLSHGPPARRPDVTTRALLKKTRARRAEQAGGAAPPQDRGGHDCH